MAARRSHGTGSLTVRRGKWFGQWRVGDRQVSRVIGPTREPGSRDGLTRVQAERQLRRLMEAGLTPAASTADRLTVAEAGERYLRHLEALGRKRSTLDAYESALRVHLGPHFAGVTLDRIDAHAIERFMADQRRSGKAPKSTLNYLGVLHSIFTYAERKGWARGNPCKAVDKPKAAGGADPDIRYLDHAELEALVRAVPDDTLGPTERALYVTAAMTGLRQGELIALRWLDVDWTAGRLRVRRNYVRGQYGTPKSKRSTRAVPLADRVAGELERHYQRTAYQADDDLVFGHPLTGNPLDRSKVLKRFKAALARAGVRQARFHDLRHTFGTRMAGAGVPLRTLQEWMGHRDFKTTLINADYQPDQAREAELVERAFGAVTNPVTNPSGTERTERTSEPL